MGTKHKYNYVAKPLDEKGYELDTDPITGHYATARNFIRYMRSEGQYKLYNVYVETGKGDLLHVGTVHSMNYKGLK